MRYQMPAQPLLLASSSPRPSLNQLVARQIRGETARQGMKRIDLANLTGMPYSRVLRLCSAECGFLLTDVSAIAEVLGVRETFLIPEEGWGL